MNSFTFSCPCLFGLESVLSGEIKRLGGQNIITTDGKVVFQGDAAMLVRANLWLRTAERVQILLGQFHAESFEELFQGVLSLPLEDFIGRTDAFPVKGWSLNSKLHSLPDCQAIIKKAVVERLRKHYHVSWFEETGPVHQIQFSIRKDEVSILLDTSGAGLHKRGYRANSNAAPIKETLAAGICDLAHVRSFSRVYDPFCGSGTLLIEAALKAFQIAPGIRRGFAADKWGLIPDSLWADERKAAHAAILRNAEFTACGYDIDPEAVRLSQENIRKAGVGSKIHVRQGDIRNFSIPEEHAITLCNPPYGERMLEIKDAEKLYTAMGKVFPQQEGRCYYIISPHENFEDFFGRPADKRRKLYNGMIKCQLFMYFK